MGVYLSKPVKDKVSHNQENKFLKCGSSSMQGWRMSQEDAHNCCLQFDEEVSLFAVYDGHGGAEVADYASKHLPDVIKETDAYKEGNYEKALKDAFLSFDATLITEPVLEELKKIAGNKGDNAMSETDDDEEDDVQGLREEARMPLADVIARYTNGTIPKTPALKRIAGQSSKSPFLRARPPSSTSDSEVTSSSEKLRLSSNEGSSSEVLTNGITVANGEQCPDPESSSSKADNCDVVSSSSTVNGESSPSSTGRMSAKRASAKMFRTLVAAAEAEDESDSDENDESFCTNVDTSVCPSSDSEDDEEEEKAVAQENENGDVKGDDDETDEEEVEEEEGEEEEEDEVEITEDASEVEEQEKKATRTDTNQPGKDSGCTAVVSLVTRDRVIVANAGDSRAVLCRQGEAVDLSVDHKPEDPSELKRITTAGGRVSSDGRVNGGLNLSRALGDHMYKKTSNLPATEQMITALPDIKSVDLKEGEDEFIVLACDGIWNSMTSQEVVDFIRPLIAKGETLSAICEKLFENCLADDTLGDGTGCDNMTCVLVQLFPHLDLSGAKRKCDTEERSTESNKRIKTEVEKEER